MKKLFTLFFILSVVFAKAQPGYDSTKNRQTISAYGYDYGNISAKTIVLPKDTVKMAYKDSGAVCSKGGKLWIWNGRYWIVAAGSSVDSTLFKTVWSARQDSIALASLTLDNVTTNGNTTNNTAQFGEQIGVKNTSSGNKIGWISSLGISGSDKTFYLPNRTGLGLISVNNIQDDEGTGNIRYNLYRRSDSVFYNINDNEVFAYKDSAAVGSGVDSTAYHTVSVINDSSFVLCDLHSNCDTIVIAGTDTSSLSNRINQRVKYTDTTTMLSAYQTAINTNTANIALKLNKTDTTGMRAQLIAGSNVTITGTYPTLTIASSGGSSGWGLAGNAITAGQFVGTTNNTSFRLHSNNVLRILADSIGKVFIDSIYVGRGIGAKYNNVAIGDSVLQRNTTGNGNTAIGDSALQLNTSGVDNTAIGNKAGRAITSNGGNTFVGSNAGLAVNSIGNTAVGNEALKAAAGNFNTALGFYALRANSGANNIAVGVNSLLANTSGIGNIAIGYNAAAANLTGGSIVVIGDQAVKYGTGSYTTAVGASTLTNLTTGVANSCFGYNAGWGITTGSYNVIIGGHASALPGSRSNYVIINDGGGNAALTRDSLYRTGLGTITTPTALLHIAAGTTTIAPIKLTSGTNLTTPEAGAIEYNGTNLFFTPASAARNSVLITASVNTVSPTSPDRTITVVINGTTYYLAAKTTND